MCKNLFSAIVIGISVSVLSAQEALKSAEEEYYDFLSLTGITERPTLGYRTLSDSEWKFNEIKTPVLDAGGNPVLNEDGTPLTEGIQPAHPWQNNNLGTKHTFWQSENQGGNWFTRGFSHSVKFKTYGLEWYNSFNTAAPYGQNDGALWQGKGYNTSLSAGARLEGYGFEVTIKPQICFSQNLDFDLMPSAYKNEYAYFQPGIDLPQRFGDSAYWTFDWGDTEIRWTWKTFTVGFGTQSPWLGPAWLNPMLGSNNAATYPKLDFGLRKTAIHIPHFGWHIGDIEGRIWTGCLKESDYFDDNPDNNYRMLNALSVSFAPSFIPGLAIGLNRIFITKWNAKNLEYIGRLFTASRANDVSGDGEDQKAALFANWRFPRVGFEFFGEYGFDDFSDNIAHTAIYSVGVKQNIPLPKSVNLKSELIIEVNNFEMSQDFQLEWPYSGFYSHGKITQGYTSKGQILGAGTGYAGSSQFVGYRLFYAKGSSFLFFHRTCPDNNYILSKSINKRLSDTDTYGIKVTEYRACYKTIFTFGFTQHYFVTRNLLISGSYVLSFLQYTDYLNRDTSCNHRITLGVRWVR